MKLRVVVSDTYNPWFNIATEDWIFREMNPACETLYLWRNDKAVIIGRTQNPWTECNLSKMEQDGVSLARRVSGGGAVYHDLGNLIFTFFSPRASYSRARNNDVLIKAISRFGITAEVSGRNDLVVPFVDGPRKFSGSAFRETRDRAFHHGTLLIRSDLDKLSDYLTPNPKKLASKGKVSVRSRVANLSEIKPITHEELSQAIIEEFFLVHDSQCKIEYLSPKKLNAMPDLQNTFEFFSNWDWRFGQSPAFNHTMTSYLSWGFFEVHIQSEDGRIKDARVFSDTLSPDLILPLQNALVGKKYLAEGIQEAIAEAQISADQAHVSEDVTTAQNYAEFATWLTKEIEI